MRYNFGGFTGKANAALNYSIIGAEQLGHIYWQRAFAAGTFIGRGLGRVAAAVGGGCDKR